jgi:hypothetical protein
MISVSKLAGISILFFFAQLIQAIELRALCSPFSRTISTLDCYYLVLIRALANHLPFSSGTLLSGIILKQRNNISYANFSALMLVSISIMLLITVPLLIVSIFKTVKLPYSNMNTPWFITVILLFLLVAFILTRIFPRNRISLWLISVKKGLQILSGNIRIIALIIVLKASFILITSARIWWIADCCGYYFSIWVTILIITSTSVIQIGSLLPGNIGLREAVSGGATRSSGLFFGSGVIVMTIDRIITSFWIFVLGIASIFIMKKSKVKHHNENTNNIK